jgi:hypothetical protein
MALTDVKCRGAKPGKTRIKLSDGGGLQFWYSRMDRASGSSSISTMASRHKWPLDHIPRCP